MSRRHHRHKRFKLRSFYVWHRYMGVTAALFVLLLSVTGILLNHTERFAFDSRHVQSDWILDWYGIQAPDSILVYRVGERHVALMGEHLYLDRREIEGNYRRLVGAARLQDMIIAAVGDGLLLLTPRGEIIEQLTREDGVPAGIERIGIAADGDLVVQTRHESYRPDADFIRWTRRDGAAATALWSEPGGMDADLMRALQNHYRGEVLPLERLLLDLHSGRFFGAAGPWVMDAAALLLILLALSGIWIWLRRKR